MSPCSLHFRIIPLCQQNLNSKSESSCYNKLLIPKICSPTFVLFCWIFFFLIWTVSSLLECFQLKPTTPCCLKASWHAHVFDPYVNKFKLDNDWSITCCYWSHCPLKGAVESARLRAQKFDWNLNVPHAQGSTAPGGIVSLPQHKVLPLPSSEQWSPQVENRDFKNRTTLRPLWVSTQELDLNWGGIGAAAVFCESVQGRAWSW